MIRVGVTGGIGSGKTTLCQILEGNGVPVYYSDERARRILNGGAGCTGDADGAGFEFGEVRRRVVELLGEGAYRDSRLDSAYVAGKVFADRQLLVSLDAIVHPAVAADFEAWARAHADSPYVVLESAVLVESGFDRFVDCVVAVSAPVEVRVEWAVARGGMSREDVVRRMENQLTDAEREERAWFTVRNDGGLNELAFEASRLDGRLREFAAADRFTAGSKGSNDLTDKQLRQ